MEKGSPPVNGSGFQKDQKSHSQAETENRDQILDPPSGKIILAGEIAPQGSIRLLLDATFAHSHFVIPAMLGLGLPEPIV
jgi:hypothetical protein